MYRGELGVKCHYVGLYETPYEVSFVKLRGLSRWPGHRSGVAFTSVLSARGRAHSGGRVLVVRRSQTCFWHGVHRCSGTDQCSPG